MIRPGSMRACAAAATVALLFFGCTERTPGLRLILLISVDTLRADHLGAYGNELDLTPQLDALAAESQVFEWAFAPASFTLPSVASLLTGRLPQEIGVRSNRSSLHASVPTLATALRDRGFRTAAVVSNLVLDERAGLSRGFDHYDDELPDREATRDWPERGAAATTRAAIEVLDSFAPGDGEPLFLWVHYQDPHGPYTPPEGLRERFLDAERSRPGGDRTLPAETGHRGRGHLPGYQDLGGRRDVAFYRAGYDGEIHHLDAEVGRLIDRVRDRDLGPASLLVFTADHGESLGENDYWFAHGDRLDEGLVRVPLMIRAPDAPPGRRNDVAGLVDVAPTILGRLPGASNRTIGDGRDLLAPGAPLAATEPLLSTLRSGGPQRAGIVSDGYKLVITESRGAQRRELHRLGAGPRNLAHADPARLQRLTEKLRRRLETLDPPPTETERPFDARDRAHLEALGYVDDGPSENAP